MNNISRRSLIYGVAATTAAVGVAGAARLAKRSGLIPPDWRGLYGPGETLTYASQRLLSSHTSVRQFPRSMISKDPFANRTAPLPAEFKQHEAGGFKNWQLTVDGLVAHPMTLSLADLRSMAVASQVTEVACEEGWSYIAEWIGTPLPVVLREAGMLPQARYVVYQSIQNHSYDSLDVAEASHPHTLITWGMNDGDLPVPFGGPIRMRVPRQLGYKSKKFILRVTATDSLAGFGKGRGSSAADGKYAWYAGI